MRGRNRRALLRDARDAARIIAESAGWHGEKAAHWIEGFVSEVRYLAATPPLPDSRDGRDWPIDDDLPF